MIPELLLISAFIFTARMRMLAGIVTAVIFALPLEALSPLPIGAELISLLIAFTCFRKARHWVIENHWMSSSALAVLYVGTYMFVKMIFFLAAEGGGWEIVIRTSVWTVFLLISFALFSAVYMLVMMGIYGLGQRRKR